MDILGLSTSPSSGGAYALILNEIEGNRRLPIIIGTFEAQAIALELEHIKPPRPMTHDLLKNMIQNFGSSVKQVFINDLSEGTFFAKIIYEDNGKKMEQDARPSDAIALAVRFNATIYVAGEILEEAGIVLNANTVPGETRSAFNPSGIRAGTPALTTRGFDEDDCREVADLIYEVVEAPHDEAVIEAVSERVDRLTDEFTLYD